MRITKEAMAAWEDKRNIMPDCVIEVPYIPWETASSNVQLSWPRTHSLLVCLNARSRNCLR